MHAILAFLLGALACGAAHAQGAADFYKGRQVRSTEFGRPYVLPPGVPADRVAVLRKAFADTLSDPELIAEAARMKLDMTYRPPGELERLVASLYETPPAMIEAIKKLVPNL